MFGKFDHKNVTNEPHLLIGVVINKIEMVQPCNAAFPPKRYQCLTWNQFFLFRLSKHRFQPWEAGDMVPLLEAGGGVVGTTKTQSQCRI